MDETLAPYAARSAASRGREHPEPEHPFRSIYQRDRDRIIHCSAFRRLEYKTQVFVNREGDHYRTRLTHTLEVAQISRTISRALRLNEDLTEAVALAHDLGHTPFGHSGEETLNALMTDHGGFEHNVQGLRVVDLLEQRYPDFPGLNLSYEVREAFVRHNTKYDQPRMQGAFYLDESPLLEIQATVIADEIAYDNHDIDDGLFSGLLDEEELCSVELWKRVVDLIGPRYRRLDPAMRRAEGVRRLINLLVTDVIRTSAENIERLGLQSVEDVRACTEKVICSSPDLDAQKEELERFLYQHFYKHYRVLRMTTKAQSFLRQMFLAYLQTPALLPPEHAARIESESTHRVICDYIAGMTDRYAEEEYRKLFQPFEKT